MAGGAWGEGDVEGDGGEQKKRVRKLEDWGLIDGGILPSGML